GDPEQPVLAPAVGPGERVLVGEGGPVRVLGRVVLADGAPLPLAQVRPPPLPVPLAAYVLGQPPALRRGCDTAIAHRSIPLVVGVGDVVMVETAAGCTISFSF